ncbi:MAG: branched-chain amino acid ABC transporter permease [Gemmatimonadales bacterium]
MATTSTRHKNMITSYAEDIALFGTGVRKFWFGFLVVGLVVLPWAGLAVGGNYFPYLLNLLGISAIVAMGLNLLTGSTGLVSLGHAAFVAVGAYTAAFLANRLGCPFLLAIPASAVFTGCVGVVVGLPALRIKGIYLALATLAFQFIAAHVFLHWESVTGGANGIVLPAAALGGFEFDTPVRFFYITATAAVLLALGIRNIMRSRLGRALLAVRDSDVAAEAMGVHLARYKTMVFGVSAAYAGLAGCLFAYFLSYIGPDHFTFQLSIEYLAMIIVGGLGSILGAVLGAVILTLLPEALRFVMDILRAIDPNLVLPDLRAVIVGLILILMILFEPHGLAGRWHKIRRYWTTWPF